MNYAEHFSRAANDIDDMTTKQFPRTMLEAFPQNKAEYACALERPRRHARFPWRWVGSAFVLAYILLPVVRHMLT